MVENGTQSNLHGIRDGEIVGDVSQWNLARFLEIGHLQFLNFVNNLDFDVRLVKRRIPYEQAKMIAERFYSQENKSPKQGSS